MPDVAAELDAGTGALGDQCTPGGDPCQTGLECWPGHTPLSSQDMFHRCAYDCSASNPTRTAYCEATLGGTCQSYQTGATDTICVPRAPGFYR